MKVRVTRGFLWAGPSGNHVHEVPAGAVVEGRAAEVALELGRGEEVAPPPPPPKPRKTAKRVPRMDAGAPRNRSLAGAPDDKDE